VPVSPFEVNVRLAPGDGVFAMDEDEAIVESSSAAKGRLLALVVAMASGISFLI